MAKAIHVGNIPSIPNKMLFVFDKIFQMNNKDWFNWDDKKILKRAAELKHNENIDDDDEGLTLKKLEQVSKKSELILNMFNRP